MATRHASAVKAHRQTIKRTEHNRALRSKLRTALKAIRARHRRRRHGRRQGRSEPDVLGHRQDVGQGHHPRQRGRPLQVADRQAPGRQRRSVARDQVPTALRRRPGALSASSAPAAGRHGPPGQFHHQPFDEHALVSAGALQGQVRPQQRVEAGFTRDASAAASLADTHHRNCPTMACAESPRSNRCRPRPAPAPRHPPRSH